MHLGGGASGGGALDGIKIGGDKLVDIGGGDLAGKIGGGGDAGHIGVGEGSN